MDAPEGTDPLPFRSWFGSLDASHLVALFGFSCYLIWELFGVFEILPFLSSFFSFELVLVFRVAMFFALFVGFLAVAYAAPKLAQFSKPLALSGGATAFIPLAIALIGSIAGSLPLWAGGLAWFSFGLSLSMLMCLWAVYFETAENPRTPPIATIGSIVSFAVFLLLSLAQAPQSVYLFVGFLLVASTLATRVFLNRSILDSYDGTDARPLRLSIPKVIHSGAYGVIYGFVLTFLLSLGEISVLVGSIGGLAGCGLAWMMISKGSLFNAVYLRRITFAPVVVAVLFLPVGGTWSYMFCGALIICACICTAVASWVIASREAVESRRNPLVVFCLVKTPGWFGIFIGALMGGVMLVFTPDSFPVATTALAAIICISFSIFEMRHSEKTDAPAKTPSLNQQETRFQKRCSTIIGDAGLSPREAEVFQFLAKGRNAEHIAQALCIAKPTAKTHIQHIYQKLGVNSHQELIDTLENTPIE